MFLTVRKIVTFFRFLMIIIQLRNLAQDFELLRNGEFLLLFSFFLRVAFTCSVIFVTNLYIFSAGDNIQLQNLTQVFSNCFWLLFYLFFPLNPIVMLLVLPFFVLVQNSAQLIESCLINSVRSLVVQNVVDW